MKTVLVSPMLSNECKRSLEGLGLCVREIPPYEKLSGSVSTHPDMLFFPLPDGSVRVGEEYYNENREFFASLDVRVEKDPVSPRSPYPLDVRFDVLALKGSLYGKAGSVSEKILCRYEKFTSVKQGYARCSVAVISENAVITADPTLALALESDSIRVLKIKSGHIALEGFDCGFIGGAGGSLGDNLYCFFGDVSTHPDGEGIIKFMAENGITAVMLSGEPLSDHGGLLLI